MLSNLSRLMIAALTLGCSVIVPNEAYAQGYPARVIRLIIPNPPGGPGDIVARPVATRLSELLGRGMIVENRPGASTIVGTEAVAKAAPDGYTLLLGSLALVLNPSLYKSLPYDARKDFTPIGLIASSPLVLVVSASLPVRNLQELIALAKSQPGKLSYGSTGAGNLAHLGPELFKAKYGLDILNVPYKGAGPALTDLVAGHTSFSIIGLSAAKGFIGSGRLRALAITGDKRARSMPDLPTFGEEGAPLPEMRHGSWWGLVGPAGLPREIVLKVNQALAQTLATADIRARLEALDIEPAHTTPEAFADWMNAESETWAEVVKRARITPE